MQRDIRFQALLRRIRHPAFVLLLCCTAGLLFGILLAMLADTSIFSLMRRMELKPVSIVMCLAVQVLPFLITAYAASLSQLWLLNTACCFKLFFFSYTGAMIRLAFGSAGWLVRFLFLFSDIILIPCMCWFCFRRVMGEYDAKKDFWICIGILAMTSLVDCLFISPFLAKIM